MDDNNADNNDDNNADNNDDNLNIINNNYYAEEYRIDNDDNNNYNREPMNSQVLPIAMYSNMLRMLYEIRVPLYAVDALGGGAVAGGAHDNMEQAAVEVLARSLYDSRPVKHVIDVADGESGENHGICAMTYDPETAEKQKINTACGIWQEEFEAGEAIKVLPCNHAFKAEAITKWLTTEKAECPICRFKLASKEVIVHSESAYGNRDDGDDDGDDDDDDDDDGDGDRVRNYHYDDEAPRPQPQPQQVNEQRARENNIMNRQNIRIHNPVHAGGAADIGRDAYYGISMPMNQLLQMRGRLVHGGRVGGGGAAAAASLSSQPSQVSQPPPPVVVTNINNYYINRISQYHVSAEEQEEADIEEAIRRSLQ